MKKKKVPIIFEVAPYLYSEYGYTHFELVNLFKKLKYNFYNIYNLNKIKDINSFMLNIQDGSSKTLLAK